MVVELAGDALEGPPRVPRVYLLPALAISPSNSPRDRFADLPPAIDSLVHFRFDQRRSDPNGNPPL